MRRTSMRILLVATPNCSLAIRPGAFGCGVARVAAHCESMTSSRTADITGLGLRAPLIGRQRSMQDLFEVASEVRAGRTRITTLVGPTGIGKTRLASDVAF
jgi:MoxR-like ATPase